jgi:putative endonuclease
MKSGGKKMPESWWVYFIECVGGELYIGVAKDVAKRFDKHASGKGAIFTRTHPPARVVASVRFSGRSEATRIEYQLKRLNVVAKRRLLGFLLEDLIKGHVVEDGGVVIRDYLDSRRKRVKPDKRVASARQRPVTERDTVARANETILLNLSRAIRNFLD